VPSERGEPSGRRDDLGPLKALLGGFESHVISERPAVRG
jgi:hypothetical protein